MAIFPFYDEMEEKLEFSNSQMRTLAALQYLMIIFAVATLVWIFLNALNILYRQKKYQVLPLVNIYCIATFLVIFRIVQEIYLVPMMADQRINLFLLG